MGLLEATGQLQKSPVDVQAIATAVSLGMQKVKLKSSYVLDFQCKDPVVYLALGQDPLEERLAMARAIGHLLYDNLYGKYGPSTLSPRVEAFARHLLAPLPIVKEGMSDSSELANRLQVPYEVVVGQLSSLMSFRKEGVL